MTTWQRDRWLYPIFIRGSDLPNPDYIEYRDPEDVTTPIQISIPVSGYYYMGAFLPTGFNSLPEAILPAINSAITAVGGSNSLDIEYAVPHENQGSISGLVDIGESGIRFTSDGSSFSLRAPERANGLSRALGLPSVYGPPLSRSNGWVESNWAFSVIEFASPHTTYGIWHTPKAASDKRRMRERGSMVSGDGHSFVVNWDKNLKRKIRYRNIHPIHVGSVPHRTHNSSTSEAYGGLLPYDTGNAFQDMWNNTRYGEKILLYHDGGSGTSMASFSYDIEIVTISPQYSSNFQACIRDLGFGERYDIQFEVNVEEFEMNY